MEGLFDTEADASAAMPKETEPYGDLVRRLRDLDMRSTREAADALEALTATDAENARLREEVDAVAAAIGSPRFMDPPDGGSVTLAEQVARMREALEAIERNSVPSQAATDVLVERHRQVEAEGWTPEHDDEHSDGSLALAAACYAEGPSGRSRVASATDDVSGGRGDTPVWRTRKMLVPVMWPRSWSALWWKPSANRRRDLVKAGALILAEIERLDRNALASSKGEAE